MGIRICITPARALEAKVWLLLLLEPKARQGPVRWCLLLQDCLATAKAILTAFSLHLAPVLHSPAAGGWARHLSKAWCAPWQSSICPLKDLAAPAKSVTSVPVAPGQPYTFSWTAMALKSLHSFISELWQFQIIVSHLEHTDGRKFNHIYFQEYSP